MTRYLCKFINTNLYKEALIFSSHIFGQKMVWFFLKYVYLLELHNMEVVNVL